MLSYTCKTAIKAVIYLASKGEQHDKAGMKEIAKHIHASEHTVGKILQTLVRQGLINSTKGPSGGFYISETQRNQPISSIVESIEGDQVFKSCGLGLSKCSASHPCPIHDEYKVARDLIEKLFREKKVKDLCDPVTNGLAFLIG
ncbi:MAG: Rrf2 family transcriptional regulator [Pedobacter sp.]|jgi:Rrf2 family protein